MYENGTARWCRNSSRGEVLMSESSRSPVFGFAVLAVLAGVALSCSTGRSSSATSVVARATSATVLEGPNGVIVRIPAGALVEDTTITIAESPRSRRPGGAIAVAPGVRLTPAGQTFLLPVEIEIPIDAGVVPAGSALEDVRVHRNESGSDVFVPLPTRRRGAAVATITEHFSDFVAVVAPAAVCGDAMCLPEESCESCPVDCGLCLGAGVCGNIACESNESCSVCDFDCGSCTDSGVPDGGTPDDAGPVDAGPTLPSTTVSGITWLMDPFPGPLTFDDAAALCAGLDANGASDWRVPTRLEWVGLLDLASGDPAFDPTQIHVAMGSSPWTSTEVATVPTSAWRMNSNGLVAASTKDSTAGTNVYCVRDAGGAPTPYVFVDNGDGTVTHVSTGLIWQQAASLTTRDQAASVTSCATVSLGTLTSGWRAPDFRELQLLVDDRRVAPAIDPTGFPSGSASTFWSSTGYPGDATRGFAVSFNTGASQAASAVTNMLVRCVHDP